MEKELANMQKAKSLADDKASSLREALFVKSERLVDAENTIRDREELIQKKDADIKQYKRWASENKIKVRVHTILTLVSSDETLSRRRDIKPRSRNWNQALLCSRDLHTGLPPPSAFQKTPLLMHGCHSHHR